ncbi:hypothetical protein ES703_85387 [subsurface metagenome]
MAFPLEGEDIVGQGKDRDALQVHDHRFGDHFVGDIDFELRRPEMIVALGIFAGGEYTSGGTEYLLGDLLYSLTPEEAGLNFGFTEIDHPLLGLEAVGHPLALHHPLAVG